MIIRDVIYGVYYIQYIVSYIHRFDKLIIIKNTTETCLHRVKVRKTIYLENCIVISNRYCLTKDLR